MKEHGKITERQFAGIIANTLIGVGILILPKTATKYAETGGWITISIAGLMVLVIMMVLLRLGLRFPEETIIEYIPRVIGKYPGFLINLVICLAWFGISALTFRVFAEMLASAVLPQTPMEVILLAMLVVVVYFIRHDLEVFARVNELYFLLIITPIIVGSLLSLKEIEVIKLMPFWGSNPLGIIKGIPESYLAFGGFEIVALFIPSLTTQKLAYNYGIKGLLSPLVVYISIVILVVGAFGVEEVQNLTWPLLELVKITKFPGILLERVEILFISFWVIAVFTTVSNFLYSSILSFTQLFKIEDHKTLVFPLLPLFFLISHYPDNINQVFHYATMLGWMEGILFFSIIVFIYLIAVIRGVKGDQRR